MIKAKLGVVAMVAALALLVAVALAPAASAANGRPGPVAVAQHRAAPAAPGASALLDIGVGTLGVVFAAATGAVCLVGALVGYMAKLNQVAPNAAQAVITYCSAYVPTAATAAIAAAGQAGLGIGAVLADLSGRSALPILAPPGSPIL